MRFETFETVYDSPQQNPQVNMFSLIVSFALVTKSKNPPSQQERTRNNAYIVKREYHRIAVVGVPQHSAANINLKEGLALLEEGRLAAPCTAQDTLS